MAARHALNRRAAMMKMFDCYDGKPVTQMTQLFKSRHFTKPSFAERERIIEIFRSEPILFRRLPLNECKVIAEYLIAATTTGNENKTPSDDAVKKKIATRRALAEHIFRFSSRHRNVFLYN